MSRAGRAAVVVGGTSGMGLAIAEQLVADGVRVIVTGRREESVAGAARTLGEAARVVRSDATVPADRADLTRLAQETFGTIDALFVNVGAALPESMGEVTEQSWDHLFDVTVKGPFFVAQGLLPLVRPGGGAVFTTLTTATAAASTSVVLAAKGALRELARGLAAETVTTGVRVNTIAPGYIEPSTAGSATATEEQRAAEQAEWSTYTPMGRLASPQEMARAAIFLALDATFSTGIELLADGGLASIDPPEPTA